MSPGNKVFYMSENRNSDDIAVTQGSSTEWHDIKDEEYKARKFFRYNDIDTAARYILDQLELCRVEREAKQAEKEAAQIASSAEK
jgi:hypothetical protein